ncbi:MAG: CHAT domain-containing protein, partial [Pseudomonadota bacterium]
MDEDDIKKNGVKTESIDEILRERGRLDQIIQEKFRKKMAILFSDICGFTKYMDTRGDIAGRAWVQRHHDIVLPLIERHEGRIVDIMGDGVLASFSTTLSAVKASIAIQKGLEAYNQRTDPADEIHVSMGINTGEVLVDGDNIAGDVVNVASRIESHAGKDQILVSRSAYADVRGSEDVLCRAYDSIMVKGKSEPLELYRVVWQDEDVVLSSEPRIRAREEEVEKKVKPPLRVLQLEITREEDRLKISAYEQSAGEVSTIRRYEEIPVPMEKLGVRCREVVETLNKANRRGRMTREVLVKLREIGQVFCDELFTLDVKEKIKETNADHLILNLDDQLVHIPWELLHEGKQFLCQRFNMGRLVKTRQSVQGIRNRVLARPLKMLILADPKGDLKGAYQEGSQIRDYFDRGKDFINVLLRSDNITPDYIKEKIRNFDLVHFAGHADYNQQDPEESGWRLTSGTLQAREIIKMAGTAAMPALIFSNACQSARTEEWNIEEYFQDEIFGLANAFILAGVKHYVGTFWEILDEPSRRFAMEFYKHLFSDMSIGEAIRQARMTLIKEYGEETIVWGSYLLYGDPTYNYMAQIQLIEAQDLPHRAPQRQVGEPGPPSLKVSETDVRAREEVIDFGQKEIRRKRWPWLSAALGIILLALVLLFGYPGFLKPDMTKYENAVITYYSQGNFDEALNACNTLEDKNSKVRLAYLIRGHIYLQMGKLKEAEVAYQRALQASEGTEKERADAFIGLGRIASVRNQTDVALKYYQQATEADPASKAGYMSLGL